MDNGKRGRGRGIRKPQAMPDLPDKDAMDKLKEEKASLANSALTPEQVADASNEEATEACSDDAAKLTTTGQGETPPLAQDLKEAMRGGVEVGRTAAPSSSVTVTIPNKLNPSAPTFVPMSTSTYLDPNFVPNPTAPSSTSASSRPIYTKNSIPTTTSSPSSSRLDPKVKEFVPGGFPSVPPVSNGDVSLYGNGDVLEDEMGVNGYMDITDILRGFERAAPTKPSDSNNETILQAAAGMLLKAYNYPGSFDEIGKSFQSTVSSNKPSEDTLINLAEMLIHWGVTLPELRYTSSRLCHLISEMDSVGDFKFHLISRLQSWHKKCYKKLSTDEEKFSFSNFTGFGAEIYAKIQVGDDPIKFLGSLMFLYVEKLFELKEDHYIREACNILKLTGHSLVALEDYSTKMSALMKTMNNLAVDKSLSKNCTSLIMQVVELSSTKWLTVAAPVQPISEPSPNLGKKMSDSTSGLNTNAAPFVPSDPHPLVTETVYNMPVTQQPVSCASEWDEFVGEDQPVEGYDNYDSPDAVEDDYDGLDPDIELEMEAFIDEIEEHLMLQDFDPELHQEPKS